MSEFFLTTDAVRECQRRLAQLGHDPAGDPDGVLADKTAVALQAFQRQRGLPITGALDTETWHRLVEAGWSLGDRLLYVTRPALRGDDVAALQESLALLGFNPGRIDGIFGLQSATAVEEFQRNCALEPSGVLTRATLNELARLSTKSTGRRPVTEAHDAAHWLSVGHRRLVVVCGTRPLVEPLALALSQRVAVLRSGDLDEHESAELANRESAALVLCVRNDPGVRVVALHYFEGYRAHSTFGREIARSLAQALREATGEPVNVTGMAVPILRETTMPALVIVVPTPLEGYSHALAATLALFTGNLFDKAR